MAQIITKIDQSKIVTELDTYNHTATATSMYKVQVDVLEIPASSIIVTILKNGVSQGSTTVAPAALQQLVSLQRVLNCVATDVIGITIASASNSDKGPNRFKATISIHRGST